MAGTFGQFYVHIVFSPQYRANVIRESFREELQQYMTGIIQGKKHKVLAIYCLPDHVHILIGLKPIQALSDLVQILKKESTNFINEKKWVVGKFNWQAGYGYFSHSHSELEKVIKYIRNIIQNVVLKTNTLKYCTAAIYLLKQNIYSNGF